MLKINKNIEVALKAIEALAHNDKPVRVSDLAKHVGTTENFLEQIVRKLRIADITSAVRGPGGGVVLVKGRTVSALQVATALGHTVPRGNSMGSLPDRIRSRVHSVLAELNVAV